MEDKCHICGTTKELDCCDNDPEQNRGQTKMKSYITSWESAPWWLCWYCVIWGWFTDLWFPEIVWLMCIIAAFGAVKSRQIRLEAEHGR